MENCKADTLRMPSPLMCEVRVARAVNRALDFVLFFCAPARPSKPRLNNIILLAAFSLKHVGFKAAGRHSGFLVVVARPAARETTLDAAAAHEAGRFLALSPPSSSCVCTHAAFCDHQTTLPPYIETQSKSSECRRNRNRSKDQLHDVGQLGSSSSSNGTSPPPPLS